MACRGLNQKGHLPTNKKELVVKERLVYFSWAEAGLVKIIAECLGLATALKWCRGETGAETTRKNQNEKLPA